MTDLAPPLTTARVAGAGPLLGEGDTIRQLYREYGRAVYGVAYRMLGDRSRAEEAQQQTFVQAWKAADSFDTSRDPGPWLFTIAKRVAIDIYRREHRREHDGIDTVRSADLPTASLPDLGLQHWEVRRVVDSLPDDERVVVRMQHFEGFSHTEISDRLGVPLGTVKSRSARAHRRLASLLAHLREEQA